MVAGSLLVFLGETVILSLLSLSSPLFLLSSLVFLCGVSALGDG
jgi:hypothetical protein